MKKIFLLLSFVLGSFVLVNAQRNPQPAPTPNENPINSERQKEISGRSDNLRLTEKFPVHTNANTKVFRESIRPLYRDLKRDEKELLAPNKEDFGKYAEFLKQKNTGLIKLISDRGCDKEFNVVISSPHCDKYSMPGAAASYSFRTGQYRLRQLGDIVFTGDDFQGVGELTHGIFVNIGDVPLEKVDLQTNSISFLMSIAPSEDMEKADELTKKLLSEEGIKNGEFTYRSIASVAENMTYILRSIAYRGNIYRTVQGMMYDELEFDKRREITVAFRIVRLEGEESATILWKELDTQKTPKLKF
jgi:hypothetical protein